MDSAIALADVYAPSDDVVARTIEGEIIIVPLTSGIGDNDETIFSLNSTGQVIWSLLDGKRSLLEVLDQLTAEYDADRKEIEADTTGLLAELVKRNMVVRKPSAAAKAE